MLANPKFLLLLAVVSLLAACKTNPAPAPQLQLAAPALILPEFPAVGSGERPSLPTQAEIQTLTPEQQQHFLAYFNAPENQYASSQQRVYNYLFDNTLSLQYDDETYTAAQTLELNRGNCLSLALLTTALAQLANVEIRYRWVDTNPVYAMSNNVVERVGHVKTVLSRNKSLGEGAQQLTQQEKQSIVIDYFSSQAGRYIDDISTEQFNALYFLNMAGRALADGDHIKAYWLVLEALHYDPLSASAHNMMAVVYKRMGMLAKAEEVYVFAIEHADEKLLLLKNYRLLLTQQNRTAEAKAIDKRLSNINDPSPYHWFALAKECYLNGEYQDAVRYYNKALEMAPYLHEAYLGKAQSLYQLGSLRGAEQALRNAIAYVDRQTTRSLYESKLMALTGD